MANRQGHRAPPRHCPEHEREQTDDQQEHTERQTEGVNPQHPPQIDRTDLHEDEESNITPATTRSSRTSRSCSDRRSPSARSARFAVLTASSNARSGLFGKAARKACTLFGFYSPPGTGCRSRLSRARRR